MFLPFPEIEKIPQYDQYFKPTIEFIHKFIQQIETEDVEISKTIISLLNKENSIYLILSWFISLLNHVIKIRPKQYFFIYKILFPTFYNEFRSFKSTIQDICSYINQDPNYLEFISLNNKFLKNPKIENFISSPIDKFQEFILKNDDIEAFRIFLLNNPDFDLYSEDNFSKYMNCMINFFGIPTLKNLIDIVAYYGCERIFQYLEVNGCEIYSETPTYAIAGGNFSIIHILEKKEVSFSDCLITAIQHHQYEIMNWLVVNYNSDEINPISCIELLNYDAFLKYYHNHFDEISYHFNNLLCIDRNKISSILGCPLPSNFVFGAMQLILSTERDTYQTHKINLITRFSKHYVDINFLELLRKNDIDLNQFVNSIMELPNINIDILQYLFDNGCDFNQISPQDTTPLFDLCSNPKINCELVKFLIDKGANVNNGPIYTLHYLCSKSYVTKDLIKLFLDNGADINASVNVSNFYEFPKYFHNYLIPEIKNFTPLVAYCYCNPKLKYEILNYLVDNGADILNNPFLLFLLCERDDTNMDIIKFLIEKVVPINNQYNPLCAICEYPNNSQLLQYMIEKGANINQPHQYQEPLVCLCEQSEIDTEMLKILLDNGANMIPFFYKLIQNKTKYSFLKQFETCQLPFNLICSHDDINLEAIKLFTSHGFDIKQYFKQNEFSYTWKKYNILKTFFLPQNFEAAKYLIENGVKFYNFNFIYPEKFDPMPYLECSIKSNPKLFIQIYEIIKTNENIKQINVDLIPLIERNPSFSKYYQKLLKNACIYQDITLISYLIDKGANIFAYTAFKSNRFLYENISSEDFSLILNNKFKNRPKDFQPNLFKAIQEGNYESIYYILDKSSNINKDYPYGYPLSIACLEGNFSIVKYLIEKGYDFNNQPTKLSSPVINQNGEEKTYKYSQYDLFKLNSPISNANNSGNLEIIQYLVQIGEKITLEDIENSLNLACYHEDQKYQQIFDYLYKQSPKLIPRDIQEPILNAIKNEKFDFIKYLFNTLPEIKIKDDMLILDNLIHYKQAELIDLYVKSIRLDVNSVDAIGRTPLHISSMRGYFNSVTFLIENKAEINKQTLNWFTPLDYAYSYSHNEIAKFLEAHGGVKYYLFNNDIKEKENPEELDKNLNKDCDLAFSRMEFLCETKKILHDLDTIPNFVLDSLMYAKLFSIYGDNHSNYKKSHDYCSKLERTFVSNDEIAKFLIEIGFNIDYQDFLCPLIAEISNNNYEMVEYLVEHGANVNIYVPPPLNDLYKTKNRDTPLLIACDENNFEIVQFLVEHGANVNQKSLIDGLTPLQIAKSDEIRQYLISKGAK